MLALSHISFAENVNFDGIKIWCVQTLHKFLLTNKAERSNGFSVLSFPICVCRLLAHLFIVMRVNVLSSGSGQCLYYSTIRGDVSFSFSFCVPP